MKELLRRLRGNLGLVNEMLLASLFINILGLTSSIYSIVVLRRYLTVGLDSTLITLSVGAVVAVILEFSLRRIRMSLARGLGNHCDRELAEAAFVTLSQSNYSHMSQIANEHFREVINGLNSVQQAYAPFNILTFYDAPFATLYLFVLYCISPYLAGIAACVVLVSLLSGWLIQRRMQAPAGQLAQENTVQNSLHSTLIMAPDSVRQFNWLPILQEKWSVQQDKVDNSRTCIQHDQNFAQQLGISSAMLLSILMMGFGSREVLLGNMTVATLIGGNILAARALNSINRCAQGFEQFARAKQHLQTLRNLATLPLEKNKGTTLKAITGKLTLNDVGFMYKGASSPLFESLNLTLEPGKILAVTGPNGSGKTTLAKLLTGLLEPKRGDIKLDDVNYKQFQPAWLRSQMVYLPQEPTFFNGTMRENIACLAPETDDESLMKTINTVGLTPLIEESPDGLDTTLHSGARHLSLGVRRRLALCRAMAGGGQLYILDEPTEGLDTAGRQAIAAILNMMIEKKATLVIMSNDSFILRAADYLLDIGVKPVPDLTGRPTSSKSAANVALKDNKGGE